MKFHVLTLFPEIITAGLGPSMIGRAAEKRIIQINAVNIRDFTEDKHGKTDDYPYGGGAGMLMQAQPVYDAHRSVTGGRKVRTVYLTPQGSPFDQRMAREFSREEELVLLCGHYEGIDERVLEEVVTDYVSIGDYILTGGEPAAMVLIDAVARLIPGVLGNDTSAQEESFHNDLLEYPQYSRPEVWHGKAVPKVLLSGNHREIAKWRLEQSKERTVQMRPELYGKYRRKQQVIRRLSSDKRNNIQLMECLSRGEGEILCAQGDDIIVYHWEDKICMIHAASPERGRELIKHYLPEGAEFFVVGQDFMGALLEESGLGTIAACRQFLYTEKTPLPVRHRDIRRLGAENLDYVCRHYDGGDAGYVKRRLEAGVMYGAYEDGVPVGFIGVHSEGGLGMLYVEEACRRQGIGGSLEAYAVNRMLERGWTPYCHVPEDLLPPARLQEKLGFYQAGNPIVWMSKKKQ